MTQPPVPPDLVPALPEDLFDDWPRWRVIAALGLGALLAAVAALTIGSYPIGPQTALAAVFRRVIGAGVEASTPLVDTVVWQIRLPRILLSGLAGAALAGAGSVFQGCFRNPLAEPYILGVSSAAAFGAALGIALPRLPLSPQVMAFALALFAVAAVYSLARVRRETPLITLVLSGVIVGGAFSAGVSLVTYLASDIAMREIVFWLMGGFYYATWRDVAIAGPVVVTGLVTMWALGWRLNVLAMGDEEARSLGVDPERLKRLLIVLATLVTAVTVSAVGIIAWVGLMLPHAARLLVGPDHRFAIPTASLLGAGYLIACDTLARSLTASEIPVGIVTSLVGVPYLIYLLRSRTRGLFG